MIKFKNQVGYLFNFPLVLELSKEPMFRPSIPMVTKHRKEKGSILIAPKRKQ